MMFFRFRFNWETNGWVQKREPQPTPASEARLAYALHQTKIWDTKTGGFVNRAMSALRGEPSGKVIEVEGKTISVEKVANQRMLN